MTESIRLKAAQAEMNEAEEESEIIKTLYYSIKPMTAEDAKIILEDDIRNKFLPFINVETNRVNVIYKLKDGKNFGIVEPEG
jgi:putative sigma-54 modulation protein